MSEPLKQFGPMHGERTRRHQFVSDGARGGTVVSIYEVTRPETGTRLNVELMRESGGITSADLTPDEVGWLRDACDEFLNA